MTVDVKTVHKAGNTEKYHVSFSSHRVDKFGMNLANGWKMLN